MIFTATLMNMEYSKKESLKALFFTITQQVTLH